MMRPQIENLKAQMRGVQLSSYQRALALDEYYKLLDYVEELEQLTIPAVISSVCECKVCGKPFGDKLSLYEHYDEEHNKLTD